MIYDIRIFGRSVLALSPIQFVYLGVEQHTTTKSILDNTPKLWPKS